MVGDEIPGVLGSALGAVSLDLCRSWTIVGGVPVCWFCLESKD